jgi:hypothetical protein
MLHHRRGAKPRLAYLLPSPHRNAVGRGRMDVPMRASAQAAPVASALPPHTGPTGGSTAWRGRVATQPSQPLGPAAPEPFRPLTRWGQPAAPFLQERLIYCRAQCLVMGRELLHHLRVSGAENQGGQRDG